MRAEGSVWSREDAGSLSQPTLRGRTPAGPRKHAAGPSLCKGPRRAPGHLSQPWAIQTTLASCQHRGQPGDSSGSQATKVFRYRHHPFCFPSGVDARQTFQERHKAEDTLCPRKAAHRPGVMEDLIPECDILLCPGM